MTSVLDQLDWSSDADPALLMQLVSTQLAEQDEIRKRIRQQLLQDYPSSALGWLPTVTWSSPTLVPLSSFDLSGIRDWPTWKDKAKVARFVERIKGGWHKPIVVIRVPASRYLDPVDGHTRICAYYELRRPVLAWVGKTRTAHGPWEQFHSQQKDMSPQQRQQGFVNASPGVVELASHSELLASRREARAQYAPGHPQRVAAERAVRLSRRNARARLLC